MKIYFRDPKMRENQLESGDKGTKASEAWRRRFLGGREVSNCADAADEQGKWAVGSDVIMEFIRRGS